MTSAATQLTRKLHQALELHQTGQLQQAQALYEDILAAYPQHSDAINLLGAIAMQTGNAGKAVELFGRAIAIDPGNVVAHCNSGLALRELRRFDAALASYDRAIALQADVAEAHLNRGDVLCDLRQLDTALASYRRAIAIEPGYAEAHVRCGHALRGLKQREAALDSYNQALALAPDFEEAYFYRGNVLYEFGQWEAALASYDRAIALKAEYAEAHSNRGLALFELKQWEAALASYDRAIALKADYLDAYFNRGHALHELKRWEAALASYDQAIALKPDYTEAHFNRSNVLQELERWEAALASYDRAIALKPDYAEAFFHRGNVLYELKQLDAALASYDRAIALKPDYAEAYSNRGLVLFELRQWEAALASYDRAIALKPDYAEAYSNRGLVLFELGQWEAALASYDRAIALKADYVEAHLNRALVLKDLGLSDQSLASFEHAFALQPNHPWVHGDWLRAKMQLCDWGDLQAQIGRLAVRLEGAERAAQPLAVLALVDSAPLQRRAAEAWVAETCPASVALAPIGRRARVEKIRVGYYSADFHAHPVAYLTARLFEVHDRKRFHWVGFSFGPEEPDEMTRRLSGAFGEFIDVRGKSALEIAQLSRELKIDIAVDLNGFTRNQRSEIFAHRAAPVQVSYLGYPGTMGAAYIDYIMADRVLIPQESRRHYAEQVVYLPNSFFPSSYRADDADRHMAEREFTREELGLPPVGCVFCCFNNAYKLTPEVFDIWMRILRQVEGSVLWLKQESQSAASNLRREAQARGVSDTRLIFARRMASSADHLARHRAADLFLDTLPYNAHMTASDALWAGLPVLTHAGEGFAARVAASLLTALGLPQLITTTAQEYEAMAIALASDAARLTRVRQKLAKNRLTAPLFDCELLSRHLEQAYVQMYERSQQGLAPEDLRHIRL